MKELFNSFQYILSFLQCHGNMTHWCINATNPLDTKHTLIVSHHGNQGLLLSNLLASISNMTQCMRPVLQKEFYKTSDFTFVSKLSSWIFLSCKYRIRVFFTPLNFHEFHELFWIREIKFVKCCRNVIAILVAILKFLVKTHWFMKI